MQRISVIGAGAWGTALAAVARRAGRDVLLWALEPEVAESINSQHENQLFLPGVPLDAAIRATTSLPEAAEFGNAVLLVPPAQHLRSVARNLQAALSPGTPIVICSKGVETNSCLLMSEVLAEALPGAVSAVLMGPTLAHEVAAGLPTAVTLASDDAVLGEALAAALGSRSFKAYWSDDVTGAQLGGAVKNVLAIACGITIGMGRGENARAALMTRGLAEMVRLARAKGARTETLMGLSGLGDLALTCGSPSSRNMSLGVALGEGRSLTEVLGERRAVTEGVPSAASITALATRLGVEMPICDAVNRIVHQSMPVREAMDRLLARPQRAERDDRS